MPRATSSTRSPRPDGRIELLVACGGTAANARWLHAHADVLGIPVAVPAEPDAVLLGAAMLGATAGAAYPDAHGRDGTHDPARDGRAAECRASGLSRREVPGVPADARRQLGVPLADVRPLRRWTSRPATPYDRPSLHSPIAIGGATIRNRLYRAPVLEGAGDGDDVAERYAVHFVENARHGVGLIIQGSSCIFPEGRTSPGMTCVDTRAKVLRLAPMVDAVHAEGASIFIQLGHGGLYAMEAWHEPYASQRRGPVLAASPRAARCCGRRSGRCRCT